MRGAPVLMAVFALLLAACSDEPESPGPGAASSGATAPTKAPARRLLEDVSRAWGFDFTHVHGGTGRKYLPETMGAGGCVLDFDGDGRMDLYVVQSGRMAGSGSKVPEVGNRLFRNTGARFEDVTERSRTGDRGYGMGAVAADYDGDGDTDIYVINFGANVLYRNEGGGVFTDVTAEAGVGDELWGSSASFFDADADGDLDLYLVNYLAFTVATHVECGDPANGQPSYCHPDSYAMAPDVFWLNDGDGTFTRATESAGLVDTTGKGLGVVAADFDGDGRPDLYVANDSTPNFYYRNVGGGKFEEEGLLLGVSHNDDGKTEAGMGVDVGDVDGDGAFDLFVTNLSQETNSLYLRRGEEYVYATRETGLFRGSFPFVGFGTDLADVDNDGDLDIVVANGHVVDNIAWFNDGLTWKQRGQVFLNDGSGSFSELDADSVGDLSRPMVGRGLMTLDIDNDGGLDHVLVQNDHAAVLFRNVWPERGAWIGFDLVDRGANRGAVGARVTVRANGRSLTEVKLAGGSYQVSNDPRLHFGLAKADRAEAVEITWPDGERQNAGPLDGGRYYRVERGKAPVPVETP